MQKVGVSKKFKKPIKSRKSEKNNQKTIVLRTSPVQGPGFEF